MLYSEKLERFSAAHPCETVTVDGARFRFTCSGREGGRTLVFLNGGMDAATLKSLKRKYRLAPLMLWYMKHRNYEKLKSTLIKAGMGHLRNESTEEAAYARTMFETIFKDYPREKDVHISGLLADLMNQSPVTAADFEPLAEALHARLIRTQTEALGGDRCGCRYVGDQSPALEPYKNLKKI